MMLLLSIFTALVAAVAGEDNFYDSLEITSDASARDIRMAWRKFVKLNHPETSADGDYNKFIKTHAMFNVLSDHSTRHVYDTAPDTIELDYNIEIKSVEEYERFGEFDDTPEVTVLDFETWSHFYGNEEAIIILFTSSSLPQAGDLAVAWKKLAIEEHDWLRVAVVDCDSPGSMYLCDEFGVEVIPMVDLIAYQIIKNTQAVDSMFMDHSLANYRQFAKNAVSSTYYPVQSGGRRDYMRPHWLNFNRAGFTKTGTGYEVTVNWEKYWIFALCVSTGPDACGQLPNHLNQLAAIGGTGIDYGFVDCSAQAQLCQDRFGVSVVPNEFEDIPLKEGAVIPQDRYRYFLSKTVTGKPIELPAGRSNAEIYKIVLDLMAPIEELSVEELEKFASNAMADPEGDNPYTARTKQRTAIGLASEKAELLVAFYSESEPWCTQPPKGYTLNKCDRAKRMLNDLNIDYINHWAETYPIKLRRFDCTKNSDSAEVCKRMGIKQSSGTMDIMLLKMNAMNPHWYHGPLDRTDLLQQFVFTNHNSEIHEIEGADFQRSVARNQETWFVMFYAPWCASCKRLPSEIARLSVHPEISKIMHEKKKLFTTGKMNCQDNAQMCHSLGIKHYPTLLFFDDGVRHQFDYDHQNVNEFVRFMKHTWSSVVHEFTVAEFTKKLEGEDNKAVADAEVKATDAEAKANEKGVKDIKWVIHFFEPPADDAEGSDSQALAITPAFAAASRALKGVVKFGSLNCQLEAEFCQKIGVTKYPTLKKYGSGSDKKPHFAEFSDPAHATMQKILDFSLRDIYKYVVPITSAKTFETRVLDSKFLNEPWVVFFHHDKCGRKCDEMAMQLKALASRWRMHDDQLERHEAWRQTANGVEVDKIKNTHRGLRLMVGSVNCKKLATVCMKHKIKKQPALVYFSKYRQKNVKFGKGHGATDEAHQNIMSILSFVNEQEEADRLVWRSPKVHGIDQKPYAYNFLHESKIKVGPQHTEL